MKFGKVDSVEGLDLSLPDDHPETSKILAQGRGQGRPKLFVGTPKWARADLKGFYPRGTKDELAYYSTQFNAIELNAFYYRIFPSSVVQKWYDRSDPNFTFCPKIPQLISQFRRLKNCQAELDDYLVSISNFKEKLGTCFLQMNENFSPKNFNDLENFLRQWPNDLALSVELRHADWYGDSKVSNDLFQLLDELKITQTITDTAGRRDLVHMRLTTPTAFIRYTGANHASDFTRVDDWFERLSTWKEQGIEKIYFFVHQTIEKEIPLLTERLIRKINEQWDYNHPIPGKAGQLDL